MIREFALALCLLTLSGIEARAGMVEDAQKARVQRKKQESEQVKAETWLRKHEIELQLLSGADYQGTLDDRVAVSLGKYFKSQGFIVNLNKSYGFNTEIEVKIP